MDYERLAYCCRERSKREMEDATQITLEDAATALSTLKDENEKLRETVDKYATAARVIALHLKPFCDESLPYDEMIADAARKASDELEQVKAEKDAAVESIPHECKTCVYHTVFFNGCTPDHDCANPDGGCSNNYDRWKWRGILEGDQ